MKEVLHKLFFDPSGASIWIAGIMVQEASFFFRRFKKQATEANRKQRHERNRESRGREEEG
jgi:hypothetical protein